MKLLECKALANYELFVRFEDGMQGAVYLGGVLECKEFCAWRDEANFRDVRLDPDGLCWWPRADIYLSPEIFWEHIRCGGAANTLWKHRIARREAAKYRAAEKDPAFQTFMAKAMQPPRRRRGAGT